MTYCSIAPPIPMNTAILFTCARHTGAELGHVHYSFCSVTSPLIIFFILGRRRPLLAALTLVYARSPADVLFRALLIETQAFPVVTRLRPFIGSHY